MNYFFDWALANKAELSGTIFGLIYVWLSIRQSIHTWTAGIITSLIYCFVFFSARFYAGVGLQIYYVVISLYGLWSWQHGGGEDPGDDRLKVSCTSTALWTRLFFITLLLTIVIYYLLVIYTDSPVAFGDSFTASLSIIATWMLARKKLEHWIIWVFIDLVSAGLYLYRGLYPTVLLFLVYAVMAVIGYFEWRKEPVKLSC